MSSPRPELRVDWCSYEAAKYAVDNWHYSRNMPSGRNNYLGVWENGEYIGAVVYGHSIGVQIPKTYGLTVTECIELRRVALRDHVTTVTRIISISLKALVGKNPRLRLIVSYADPMQDHVGSIYQAGNWIYVGRSASMTQFFINGRWRNDRNAYSDQRHLSQGMRKIPAKYKYLYPLDRAMRRQIAPLAQPYPKKDTRPVNGDDLATSGAGRFDSEPGALD